MTKFRAGLAFGLLSGYYLGTRAGRNRYDQINRALRRLRRSPKVDQAVTQVGRAKAVVDLGLERVHAADHLAPAVGR
jgi:hypothetical protein